jgi:hypothetical protein
MQRHDGPDGHDSLRHRHLAPDHVVREVTEHERDEEIEGRALAYRPLARQPDDDEEEHVRDPDVNDDADEVHFTRPDRAAWPCRRASILAPRPS